MFHRTPELTFLYFLNSIQVKYNLVGKLFIYYLNVFHLVKNDWYAVK